jgi:hypothetical protein
MGGRGRRSKPLLLTLGLANYPFPYTPPRLDLAETTAVASRGFHWLIAPCPEPSGDPTVPSMSDQ